MCRDSNCSQLVPAEFLLFLPVLACIYTENTKRQTRIRDVCDGAASRADYALKFTRLFHREGATPIIIIGNTRETENETGSRSVLLSTFHYFARGPVTRDYYFLTNFRFGFNFFYI